MAVVLFFVRASPKPRGLLLAFYKLLPLLSIRRSRAKLVFGNDY